jgi:hypothetical protein
MKRTMKRTMKLDIPRQLELLCTLFETTPEEVIQGFIYDVSQDGHSNGSDERWMSADYFLRCGYGLGRLDGQHAHQIIAELCSIRREYVSFPDKDKEAGYIKLKQKQLRAWYKEWKQAKKEYQQKMT